MPFKSIYGTRFVLLGHRQRGTYPTTTQCCYHLVNACFTYTPNVALIGTLRWTFVSIDVTNSVCMNMMRKQPLCPSSLCIKKQNYCFHQSMGLIVSGLSGVTFVSFIKFILPFNWRHLASACPFVLILWKIARCELLMVEKFIRTIQIHIQI